MAIAVRIHKTLELADDKFYIITCGKARTRTPCSNQFCKIREIGGGGEGQSFDSGGGNFFKHQKIEMKNYFRFRSLVTTKV